MSCWSDCHHKADYLAKHIVAAPDVLRKFTDAMFNAVFCKRGLMYFRSQPGYVCNMIWHISHTLYLVQDAVTIHVNKNRHKTYLVLDKLEPVPLWTSGETKTLPLADLQPQQLSKSLRLLTVRLKPGAATKMAP